MLKIVQVKGKSVLKGATPRGELSWVFIDGEGRANYNEDGFVYQASITWAKGVGRSVKEQIEEYYASFNSSKSQQGGLGFLFGVTKSDGSEIFVKEEDVESTDGKANGRIQMQFSTQTEFNGKPNKVVVYNAKAKKVSMPENVKIGNGTIGSLQVSIVWGESAKKQFVSRYLNAVQVIKLEEYKGENDFEEDEDEEGWTGEDVNTGFSGEEYEENADDDIPM